MGPVGVKRPGSRYRQSGKFGLTAHTLETGGFEVFPKGNSYAAQSNFENAKAFRDDIHVRAKRFGRNPHHLKILPGCVAIVGESRQEAEEKWEELIALLDPRPALARLQMNLKYIDLSGYDLDGPFPDVPPDAVIIRGLNLVQDAKREGLTLRQVLVRSSGVNAHLTCRGTAKDVRMNSSTGSKMALAMASICRAPLYRHRWMRLLPKSFLNFSTPACSGPNTRALRYGKTLEFPPTLFPYGIRRQIRRGNPARASGHIPSGVPGGIRANIFIALIILDLYSKKMMKATPNDTTFSGSYRSCT